MALHLLLVACPVCFGAGDGPVAAAANAGIFALMAVTLLVLAGIAGGALSIARRMKLAERLERLRRDAATDVSAPYDAEAAGRGAR
jgi:hypothetical protein